MVSMYLSAWAVLVVSQLAPGPNAVLVSQAGMRHGRKIAVIMVLGIASVTVIWCTLAASGLAALLTLHPASGIGLKMIGGGYLLFLGVRSFAFARGRGEPQTQKALAPMAAGAAYWRGVFVNATNPKSLMFWMAFMTWFYGMGASFGQALAFAPLAMLNSVLIYGGYALVFSSAPMRALHARYSFVFDAVFGVCFVALGLYVLLSGVRAAFGGL